MVKLTAVLGSVVFKDNAKLNTLQMPVLSLVGGVFVLQRNPNLSAASPLAIRSYNGLNISLDLITAKCSSCLKQECRDMVHDLPDCLVVQGPRYVGSPTITSLTAHALTYVEFSISFLNCSRITMISLPMLTIVDGWFQVALNSALTYLSVPLLTYIRTNIYLCQNGASFVIPAAPPVAPLGGLTSATLKGSSVCDFVGSNVRCDNVDKCP
jgi:hypothetical protein